TQDMADRLGKEMWDLEKKRDNAIMRKNVWEAVFEKKGTLDSSDGGGLIIKFQKEISPGIKVFP
ncbi:hypothetical protein HY772_10505, partial [Candidatus Woesearchaeota archaeon]|nr:hypothetical protein [Candidatus Woesearchaeota archaeon]